VSGRRHRQQTADWVSSGAGRDPLTVLIRPVRFYFFLLSVFVFNSLELSKKGGKRGLFFF